MLTSPKQENLRKETIKTSNNNNNNNNNNNSYTHFRPYLRAYKTDQRTII
jgi:hypothetical protein